MNMKFYMQRCDIEGEPVVDLIATYSGMMYVEAEGLLAKGSPKNIVVEKFADAKENKYYIPNEVYYEPTDVKLTFVFVGDTRRDVYDSFCDYLKKGKFYYWDNMRKRKVKLILLSSIEPSDDIFKGSTPYIKLSLAFSNVWGDSVKVE